MKTTYLKCIHGNDKRFGCQQCEADKQLYFGGIGYAAKNKFDKPKETKIPIYRGCGVGDGGQCFCTGRCKEIIGYHEL